MARKLIIGILLFILLYLIYHHRSVKYGLEQAYGQYKVLEGAIPLDDFLQNKRADSLIEKIELIRSVKEFAEDSLGLKKTESYEKIYDQKGKPILWMVTASPEFELRAHQWSFPIAGKFDYKGFFDLNKAKEEIKALENEGLDTDLGEVSAWSTLGFFSDPILTSMLQKDSARLADLIIHELCHASIYLKDSVELNENLASFIGRKGAEYYLLSIGDTTSVLKREEKVKRSKVWRKIIHRGSKRLDSLYRSFPESMSAELKREQKKSMIDEIRWELADKLYANDHEKAQEQYNKFKPNNAFFTSYLTYRSKSYYFEDQLEEEFNGNIKAFIEYYINEYGK